MKEKFIYINKVLAILPIAVILSISFYLYRNSVAADNPILIVNPIQLIGDECVDAGGGTGASCFTTISEAVRAAAISEGLDNIYVQSESGTTSHIYYENLEISAGNELVLVGDGDRGSVTIDGGNDVAIDIYAENITITGFNITTTSPDGPAVYIRPQNVASTGKPIIIEDNILQNSGADSLYITDQYCVGCSGRIMVMNNLIYMADKRVSTYIQYASGVVVEGNIFSVLKTGESSRGIAIQDSNNITIRNNTFSGIHSNDPSSNAYGIELVTSFKDGIYDINISGNIFNNITGLQSSAIALNNFSSTSFIKDPIVIQGNTFGTNIEYAIFAKDNTGVATEVQIDATSNHFEGVASPQGRENKITHNCREAKVLYAGHQNLICNLPDNEKGSDFLLVNHTDVAVPLFLGWNIQSESESAGEEPVDVIYDTEAPFITNEIAVAFVWQSISAATELKYIFEVTPPTSPPITQVRPDSNTDFIDLMNESGIWKAKVMAFIDLNNDNIVNGTESFSDWSDLYSFSYDRDAPLIISAPSNVVYNEGDIVSALDFIVSDIGGLGQLCHTVLRPDTSKYKDNECMPLEGTSDTAQILPGFTGNLDTTLFEEGIWAVSYTVSDSLGNVSNENSFTITINNVVPVLDFSVDDTSPWEGEDITLELNFTDPGLDDAEWTVNIDYGDGDFDEFSVNYDGAVSLPNPTYSYGIEGSYEITVSVQESTTDGGEGQLATANQTIEVLNNVPQVELTSNGTSFIEGNAITISANVTNGNPEFTYDWADDCSGYSTSSLNFATTGNSYAVAGSYSCSLSVIDIDGDRVDAGAVSFTVNDNKPIVHISTTPSSEVSEGTTVTLAAVVEHGNSPFTYTWGECSTQNKNSITLSSQGDYTCNLGVTDADGDTAVASTTIKINNNVPDVSITASPGISVYAGTAALLTANVSGGNAPYSYLWTGACNTVAAFSYAPSTVGTHICNLKVTDADGDIDESYITITVNASPTGGGNVLGTGTTGASNNTPNYYSSNNNVLAESDEELDSENTEDETGSGTIVPTPFPTPRDSAGDEIDLLSCNKKIKISGNVYFDKDDNGRYTSTDEGAVNVNVYLDLESSGGKKSVTNVKTDDKGYWEYSLCPAKELLAISLDPSTLPSRSKIKDAEVVRVNILTNADKTNLNFILVKSNSFAFIFLLLILIILAVLIYFSWKYYKKKHPFQKFNFKLFVEDLKVIFESVKNNLASRVKKTKY